MKTVIARCKGALYVHWFLLIFIAFCLVEETSIAHLIARSQHCFSLNPRDRERYDLWPYAEMPHSTQLGIYFRHHWRPLNVSRQQNVWKVDHDLSKTYVQLWFICSNKWCPGVKVLKDLTKDTVLVQLGLLICVSEIITYFQEILSFCLKTLSYSSEKSNILIY